jgi:hypothetical protein
MPRTSLKDKLDGEVHVAWAALGDHGVTGSYVGSLLDLSEAAAGIEGIVGKEVKVAPVKGVVDLPAELHGQAFGDAGVLDHRHIELGEAGTDQLVALRVPYGTRTRDIEGTERPTLLGDTAGIGLAGVGIGFLNVVVRIASVVVDRGTVPGHPDTVFFLGIFLILPILSVASIVLIILFFRSAFGSGRFRPFPLLTTLAILWLIPAGLVLYERAHPFALQESARWLGRVRLSIQVDKALFEDRAKPSERLQQEAAEHTLDRVQPNICANLSRLAGVGA